MEARWLLDGSRRAVKLDKKTKNQKKSVSYDHKLTSAWQISDRSEFRIEKYTK